MQCIANALAYTYTQTISKLVFRYINTYIWSKAGHFNKALSKGPKTTTWIWNLHDHAHDFDIQQSSMAVITRKVFSSNLAHLSLVFFWMGGMHFHGAYFSNYDIWLNNNSNALAYTSSHLTLPFVVGVTAHHVGQDIPITSGIFQLWRCQGIITHIHLKYACSASLIGTIICISGSYFHMHNISTKSFYKKFKSLSIHHPILIFGIGSISWGGHQIHISLPANPLLDSGTPFCSAYTLIPLEVDLKLSYHYWSNADLIEIILPGFRIRPLVNFALYLPGVSILQTTIEFDTCTQLNLIHNSILQDRFILGQVTAHHFTVGVVFIIVSLIGYSVKWNLFLCCSFVIADQNGSSHAQLSMNLAIGGSLSIAFGDDMSVIPVHRLFHMHFCSTTPTKLCLFYHHMWVGGFLIIGAGAHASIFIIRSKTTLVQAISIRNRDVIIGHLIWVSIALGLHSFSLYIHNDTLQGFRRPEDIFHDNSIQLKPVFYGQLLTITSSVGPMAVGHMPDIEILDKKLICITTSVCISLHNHYKELGTADFIVHHIHAFTIHVSLLILSKGLFYARNSRLVSDKLELGFRYPCDGPGRGGTCQISPSDHLYLAVFWMYNSLDSGLFHYFWKMQSDVWHVQQPVSSTLHITPIVLHNTQGYFICTDHISGGDFTLNSTTINGWLRNFLWSQAGQVIQSYGSSISGYGFIFISAHFIWAFSLMFLYSGRGYWQELIESILWAHHKLKIMPHIQPRALSISQGRAVGFIHYTLGGVGCTWAFFISRMVVLTN
jgi:photosystem I P700 chlorophyll a apoprotein A1